MGRGAGGLAAQGHLGTAPCWDSLHQLLLSLTLLLSVSRCFNPTLNMEFMEDTVLRVSSCQLTGSGIKTRQLWSWVLHHRGERGEWPEGLAWGPAATLLGGLTGWVSPLTADAPSLLLVAVRFHGGDRWPDGCAHLWPLQVQCPTSCFGGSKGQVHWDPSCCIAWALELPKGVGAARSSLSRAEMRLEFCQTEGSLRHSLALQLQEG